MRTILISIITLISLLTPFFAFAITVEDVRFDFTNGQPTVVDDSTSACNDTAVARFDFTNGQPTVVFDSTANCTTAAVDNTAPSGNLMCLQGICELLQGIIEVKP